MGPPRRAVEPLRGPILGITEMENPPHHEDQMENLKSFDPSTMPQAWRDRYECEEVGEAMNSLRTTFRVTCRQCKTILHGGTTLPTAYTDVHDKETPHAS